MVKMQKKGKRKNVKAVKTRKCENRQKKNVKRFKTQNCQNNQNKEM